MTAPFAPKVSRYACILAGKASRCVYTAEASVCNACPVKAVCTESKSGRHIFRSFFQDYLDRVKAYRETEAYQKALRKRAWITRTIWLLNSCKWPDDRYALA